MDARKKIKFGVLGCSRVALKGMLPAINDSEFAELEMVGSRNPEKSKETGTRFGAKSWGNYEDILKNKNIQVVYVSLPNALHEEWTIRALEAGKHVICEKPTAISYDAAKKMTEAAKKNNVRLLEGLMFRYHPQHVAVKKFLENGELGEIMRFEGCFGYAMPDRASNAMNLELGGGSFNDQIPYPVYSSRMIFGEEPESVLCKIQTDPQSGVSVKADITLNYPNGKTAFTSSIFGSYYQSTYSVLGTRANIRMGRAYAVPRDMPTKIFIDADDKTREMEIEPADQFRLMIDDFCEEISGDKAAKKYEDDLLAQALVLEAARLSDREKRVVRISEAASKADITLPEKHRRPIQPPFKYDRGSPILLTGGSGNLGKAILQSGLFKNILSPSHQELDVTDIKKVAEFFKTSRPSIIIHSAAVVRMAECENESWKQEAINTNIIGTCNLIKEVLRVEKEGRPVRFIFISTDGVYPGTRGNYSEESETIPYNNYGWTKLSGESVVHLLSDFCIIRTSFFDPAKIKFETSATDMFFSKIPLSKMPEAIAEAIESGFTGTVNIGGEKKSAYETYKEYKPSLKPCKKEDVMKDLEFNMATDASLDSSLWKKVISAVKEIN